MVQMLLVDNLVHSDLHPGNILVRLDPPRGCRTLARFLSDNLGLEVRAAAQLRPFPTLLEHISTWVALYRAGAYMARGMPGILLEHTRHVGCPAVSSEHTLRSLAFPFCNW